jgi:hypothetical protein
VPTGDQLRVLARAQQLDGVVDGLGDLVVKGCGIIASPPRLRARLSRGVAGISMSVIPRGASASTTALITAAVAAIVPVSPTPLSAIIQPEGGSGGGYDRPDERSRRGRSEL